MVDEILCPVCKKPSIIRTIKEIATGKIVQLVTICDSCFEERLRKRHEGEEWKNPQ